MKTGHILLGALALSLLAGGAAQAADYIATIGVRGSEAPPYEGANHAVIAPNPTFSLRPADRPYRFTPPDGGTSLAFIDSQYIAFGPMARFRYQRGDQGNLTGFKKVDVAVEPGAFVELWPFKWLRARGELRYGFGGYTGLIGDYGGDLVYTGPEHGQRFDFSVGPRAGWGSRAYMNTYFGVTPTEAVASPIVHLPYALQSGQRYTGVEVAAAYHLSDRWQVQADFGYHRLADNVTASPLFKQIDDANQYTASVALQYSFNLHL